MKDLNDKVTNAGATSDGILASGEWNQPMSEIQSVIESTGQTLTSGKVDQLGHAIAALAQGDAYFGTDSGSGTAYVVAAVNTVHPDPAGGDVALFNGMHIRFRPANANTTTGPTLVAFGLTVKNILRENGSAVAANDLVTTRDAELRYDGIDWLLLDRSRGLVPATTYPQGHVRGFLYNNNSSDSEHDIDLGAGECANHDGTFNLDFTPGTTKQINAAWAAETGVGGRSGALAEGWYRLFVIGGAAATTDWGLTPAADTAAATLMSDATTATGDTYNKYQQLYWVLTDGSSNIVQFHQAIDDPSVIMWEEPTLSVEFISAWGATRTSEDAQAPPSSIALMLFDYSITDTGSLVVVKMRTMPLAYADTAIGASNYNLRVTWSGGGTVATNSTYFEVAVDASSQFGNKFNAARSESPTGNISFHNLGFRFNRGRDE